MNRRQLLKRTFLFSAALLPGSAIAQASGDLSAETEKSSQAPTIHYFGIGDWGWVEDELDAQVAVAKGMAAYIAARNIRPEGMLLLGDNFYGDMDGGVRCPRFQRQFESMYPKEVIPGACYAVLGNHDYDDQREVKVTAQLNYAQANPQTRWTMPSKWYRAELGPKEKPLVTLLALDSNFRNLTKEEFAAQKNWLLAELEKPRRTPWLTLMAHHPLYSDGAHGDTRALITEWDVLLRKYRVQHYFCGHDHDLQHLEFSDHPTSFVISGGGGAQTRMPDTRRGVFSQGIHGFTHLEISGDTFITRHCDAAGKVLHAFVKSPEGVVKFINS